ncbi:MAG: phosphoribosyl-ATP diphosphatase [Methanomicrobiales archaeon]|nr:phosphoribosyl-ATP diphosphatase [Methanomicrobiales archaeon]
MESERVLGDLWEVIENRAANPSPSSYVSRLLQNEKGIDKALEKLGEETIEFILAAKNGVHDRTVAEAADLLFHYLIAVYASRTQFEEVLGELKRRKKK